MADMSIILSTLNARYAHASLGLRYLLANMAELREQTQLQEFVIGTRTADLAEKLLAAKPRIIGFGVYIWNVEETAKLVALLKRVAPEIVIVLGGPEVSYETQQQEIAKLADYVITGWGDISFAALCRQILQGPKPLMKIHAGVQPPLGELALPYALYSNEDIAHRTLYVEASRGCPFKCEFCLSSLDKTAWPFELDSFLAELETLHARGARLFKFVDRTFNLNVKTSLRILQFFLDKLEAAPHDPVFAHFEVVPDHLPDALKEAIARFPDGALQFEIGIQSFNPEVQALVSRRQNNDKAADNIRWLCTQSRAHLHVDLIAGLPGEDMASFARGPRHRRAKARSSSQRQGSTLACKPTWRRPKARPSSTPRWPMPPRCRTGSSSCPACAARSPTSTCKAAPRCRPDSRAAGRPCSSACPPPNSPPRAAPPNPRCRRG